MKETKRLFKQTISDLLARQGTDEVLSEAALPAYAHKNPIIDFIFWKRLQAVSRFIQNSGKTNADILDFGCGTGVFSYEMAGKGHKVLSLDLDLTPVNLLSPMIKFPGNIQFEQGNFLEMDFSGRSFDYIVALDVLEHIPLAELPRFLEKFNAILKPDGKIIVSGPTESKLYRMGRKLAGKDFTGAYHETTIARIKSVFSHSFQIRTVCRLIWPLTLFEIFYAQKIKK